MSIFDGLIGELFTPDKIQPKELTDGKALKRVKNTGNSVSQRIDDFARNYLSTETYQRYRSSLRKLRYDMGDLPSRTVTLIDMFTGGVKRYVEGVLGLYDDERNRIEVNKYVAKDPENDQLEPVMGHEGVHHATREWLRTYFKKFGEKARPVVEGFTCLISRGLGYNAGEYPELTFGAIQTLKRLGGNIYDSLYNVLNFNIDPETVVDTFYQSLGDLQQRQPTYAMAR